jgi:hypothetical protein
LEGSHFGIATARRLEQAKTVASLRALMNASHGEGIPDDILDERNGLVYEAAIDALQPPCLFSAQSHQTSQRILPSFRSSAYQTESHHDTLKHSSATGTISSCPVDLDSLRRRERYRCGLRVHKIRQASSFT